MPLSKILPASFGEPNPTNFVINGNMISAQRGSVSKSANSYGYTLDQWELSNYIDDTITVTQDSDVPTGVGLANSMKITGSSGDNSLDSADYLSMVHKFEGQNIQSLKKGTANAQPMTFSFWIKATATGTYIVEFADNDNTRKISKSYTVSSTNTWEYKSITVEADTTGAFADINNTSLWIQMWFAAGSNFTTGSLNSSWTSSTVVNTRVAGQVNGMSSASHNIYLTGVCLNAGSQSLSGNDGKSFPHESFAETLAKCQRYYTRWQADSAYDGFAPGYWLVTTQFYGMYELPVQMRQEPTIAIGGNFVIHSNGADTTAGSLVVNRATPLNVQTYSDQSSHTGTAGYAGAYRTNNDNDAYVEFKAEL